MPERTCINDGCDNATRNRLLKCRTCYQRDRAATAPPCSIQDCELPAKARGWCRTHYDRWRTLGDPGAAFETPHRWEGVLCSATECDRRAEKRGWCGNHYNLWLRYGYNPTRAISPDGTREIVNYYGMHSRLTRILGPANQRACVDCTNRAREWSYDHSDPNELIDPDHALPYSLDPSHYAPRCLPCHRALDAPAA